MHKITLLYVPKGNLVITKGDIANFVLFSKQEFYEEKTLARF
jgi:hypothetical protein